MARYWDCRACGETYQGDPAKCTCRYKCSNPGCNPENDRLKQEKLWQEVNS